MEKSKQKRIYIICFIIQVLSILIAGFLPTKMFRYYYISSFCCEVYARFDKGTISPFETIFIKEFKKVFPQKFRCTDSDLGGLIIIIYIYFAVIHFICAIIYSIIFGIKIKNNLKKDYCSIIFFIVFICFLLFFSYAVITVIPGKASFDAPDKDIYIFDDALNDKIRENLGKTSKRKIFGSLVIILIIIVIITTIIKIVILCKSKNDDNLREGQLMTEENYVQNPLYPNNEY